MTIRPRRSVLYMPGSNARAIEKARGLPADGIILDLEDAVAPDAKEAARAQVVEAVKAGGFGRREVFVRINGIGTPWFADDLAAFAHVPPDAILVPKIQSGGQLDHVGTRLLDMHADKRIHIWAMIETPLAVFNIVNIAAAARDSESRLSGFVLGTNDLAKETRARIVPGRAPMVPWLMAERSSFRNFRSFASAEAKSVALAALSFSACDLVRLNTRNPFLCFPVTYLLSARRNAGSSGSAVSRGSQAIPC